MSKSVAKHNKIKIATVSDKLARSKANRKLRRKVKQLINKGEDVLPYLRDVSDTWNFPSDGLARYYPIIGTKWQRR